MPGIHHTENTVWARRGIVTVHTRRSIARVRSQLVHLLGWYVSKLEKRALRARMTVYGPRLP